LKHIKEKLKIWNRDVFGDIKIQKHNLLDTISSLDTKEESSGLTSDEIQQKSVAKADWAKIILLEEIS